MLTLAEVLELPVVKRALPVVVTGHDALGCELRWSHVLDTADPSGLLKGGELVLTTGIGAGAKPADQTRWMNTVLDQGAAAVGVELGTTWRERVPDAIVAACSAAGVPLVAFRRQVRFVEITEAVHAAVLHRQFELLRRGEEIHRRFTEMILKGRGVPEIMAELADAVSSPVVLEDAAHELVYYVSGPAGDDVALSAWADLHRAEDRGDAPGGVLLVDVRLMDTSWGRLMALALDREFDDFDQVALERAALAVAIDLLGQQHEEHLRARSRGAFLSDLAAGVVEDADARRRAEALGFPGSGRGALLPLAASWRVARSRAAARERPTWTQLAGELRAALSPLCAGVLLGPRDADMLMLVALGSREYDEALAEHLADIFSTVLERRAVPVDDAALAIGGPAASWDAAGQGLRRVRRSAGAATALPPARWYDARRPGVTDLLHDLREAPELDAFVDEQLGPLLREGNARSRALLETLEAYLAAGGRKAQAARTLHLERQSLYLRLRRIEEILGVSLEDEDAVLGLHLAVRALRFRRRRAA
jgi:PucR family transcriptional regulator, purine catabolism regulatory protein